MKSPLRTLAVVATLSFSQHLQAGVVTNSLDGGPGSLRNAIANATNGELITFNSSLNGAVIGLTSGHLAMVGLTVSIDASALAEGVTLSGNHLSRIFLISGNSDLTLTKLRLRDGQASQGNGGAIFLAAGNLEMIDCTVSDCFATYNAGAIYLGFGTTSIFDRCRVTGNTASSLGYGGGIFIAGASSTAVTNCLFAGNSNHFGGGIYTTNSSPVFTNCTIQGNLGGGMKNDFDADPVITNCIVWGNSGNGNTASQQIKNSNGSNPQVSYSLIQGASGPGSFGDGSSTVWAPGNLNGELPASDPKFASPLAASTAPNPGGDLRLLAASPALNLGNNLSAIGNLDLLGNQRVRGSAIDLGPYEGGYVTFSSLHPALTRSGDQDGNGISNFQEYAMGYDPSAGTSAAASDISSAGGATLLTLAQRVNALDMTPMLQTAQALDGTWMPFTMNVHYSSVTSSSPTPERDLLIFQLLTTDPRRFYRQTFNGTN